MFVRFVGDGDLLYVRFVEEYFDLLGCVSGERDCEFIGECDLSFLSRLFGDFDFLFRMPDVAF